jgi:transposase
MAVSPWMVSDELWLRVEPELPRVERRFRYPGRKRLDDRAALQGDLVRALHRDCVAACAARARLWFWLDLLPADG